MAASERRCHYEVLGLAMECSADEIRSAYRKLALQLHPDKLVRSGLSQSEATAKFQELSHAYEVLSDPKERSWYDSHRSKILFAEPSSNSVVPDLFAYFSNSAFSGYSSDSKKGFFRVYSEVFGRVYANELDFARKMGLGDEVREAPAMGDLGSPYAQATAFYAYWTGFTTVMDFCWADPYDAAAGPNRKSRRVMEEENKKARKKARREYNDTVRGLAEFVRKRDKRVIDMAVKKKEEEEKRKAEARERRQREEREKMERAMAYEEPDWARADDDEVGDGYDEAVEEEAKEEDGELYCVVCGKKFKSEKQWKNHEQSKKHKEKVAQIRQEIVLEDEEDNDNGEDDLNAEEVEELEEMMRDSVHIGSNDKKDGSVNEEKEVEEDDENDEDENVVVVKEEEDEIGVLEAMLGSRKNRKKAASTLRKVEANNSDDDMEYNNVKSTRKSRRAKKGKNDEKDSNRNETEASTVEEKDDNCLAENEKQRVNKKGVPKSEDNKASKSKVSSKGKKAKGMAKNASNECEKCGEEFESKNKLHKHLSDTGHASLKYR